jgi:DNA polymerase III beta subunit, N-terminal domain
MRLLWALGNLYPAGLVAEGARPSPPHVFLTKGDSVMEFCVDTCTFADALEQIQGAVEKKSTIPILSHALVEASTTGLHLGHRSAAGYSRVLPSAG